MRYQWISIIASGLCISLVPACSPLLRQAPPRELPASATAQRVEPANAPRAGPTPSVPDRPALTDASVKPAASNDTLIEPVRYPATMTGPDLIPEPRSLAESPAAVKLVSPPEQGTENASPRHDGNAEPTAEAPVLQALRCFLDKRPFEAVGWLGPYDKSSQDLLLSLLPFTVRLTEGGLEQCDSREASTVVEQMDRVADRVSTLLRPRAKLTIKKMCFCSEMQGYGKYLPRPDGKGFLPGEQAVIYVELDNIWDERHGNAYSIHLLSTVEIWDFKSHMLLRYQLPDDGPDVSQSERHDFYMRYCFAVPRELPPGFYVLSLKIIDEPTRREDSRTLDFRVISPHGTRHW